MDPQAEKKLLVVNELLTYAFTHVNSVEAAALVNTIADFYNTEDIIKAKACLWTTYEDDGKVLLLGSKPSLHNMKLEGAALITFVEELVHKGIVIVANTPEIELPFCAVDLTKIPPYAPGENDKTSILARLTQLEHLMKCNKELTSHNADCIKALQTRSVNRHPMPRNKGTSELTTDRDQTLPMTFASATKSSTMIRGPTAFPTGQPANQEDSTRIATVTTSTFKAPSPKWQQQRNERRRILKENAAKVNIVKGNRDSNSECKLKKAQDTRDIYIRDLNPDIDASDVKGYMASNKVTPRGIRQILGKREGQKKSFKITVDFSDFDSVMSAAFWPKDVECREWYTQEQLKRLAEGADETSAEEIGGPADRNSS